MHWQASLKIGTLTIVLGLASLTPGMSQSGVANSDLPSGFEQLLERGAMASIDSPVFVSADEARMPDDAWVLGVVMDGEARAYSLNLLISHEVVNDEIAGQPVAAVW